jgi:hypothetical protein
VVVRRGRGKKVCARGAGLGSVPGPSTSPLDGMLKVTAKPHAPRRILAAIVLAASLAVSGCTSRDDLVVWKALAPSPDGQWIASADTVQNGGFGSADITTSVYLQRAGDAHPPVAILELSCTGPMPHPYVLDNVANAGGSIHLSMKWLDGSHLHVTYDTNPSVIFRATKFRDVSVTVKDLSGGVSGKRA